MTTLGQYAAVSFFIIVKFEANLAGGKVFNLLRFALDRAVQLKTFLVKSLEIDLNRG